MYGQGNSDQFHHAPPNQPTPPSVQPVPPGLPVPGRPPPAVYHSSPFLPQSYQTPPGPLPHQLGSPSLAVPPSQSIAPPAPMNMGQSYGNLPPLPYPPQPPSYSLSLPSHGTAHVPLPVPPLPRVFPPPPPPPSQGQALCQIPPPPPFHNIQHVPIPHSQPPSYFPVNPAHFLYSGSVLSRHDAQPPSLPPPPLPPPPPPSSPPPVPPSPPSVAFPVLDDVVVSSGSTPPRLHGGSTLEGIATDARATSSQSTDNSSLDHTFPVGECIDPQKKIPEDDESSRNLSPASPKPIEVVLQQCSVSQNSSKMDFPFEAIGVENEWRNNSPASSDMDMEDDGGGQLENVSGHSILKKEPVGVPMQIADERGNRYPSQALPNAKDKFTSNNDLHNFSLPLIQSDDDKDSSFTEDVTPVRLSPGDAVCAEGVHVPNFVIQDMQGASLVNISSVAGGATTTEVSKAFAKDESPFQLIQGYASDNGEENDEIDVTSVRASSSLAGLPNIHRDNKIELKFASPSILSQRTVEGNLNKLESNFEPSKNHDIMETNGMDIDQVETQQTKDARQDSSEPKLDEFGRLVRGGGVSDSDSDDMRYKDKHGNSCGSSSHWPPQEGRHRWNHSPRRRGSKNNSPRYSPLKSFRHNNKISRRDKEQHSECFNLVRGRCISGASCHFLHPDLSRTRTMHKIHQDPSQQSSTFNVHGHASDLKTDNSARKKDRQEFDKLQQEEKEEIYTKPAESNDSTAKYTVSPGSVRENGQSREVNDDVKQEDTNQHFLDRSPQLGTQHVGKLLETFDPSGGDGEEIFLESDSSKLVKNITFQSSPSVLFKKFDNNPLGKIEQVPQQGPSNKSYEKQVAANQISDEFLHQKGVQVAKSFAPDSSELKSFVQGHTPFINPTNNVSPPLASQQFAPSLIAATVSQSHPSESDVLLHSQYQIANEQYFQNIHTQNAMGSDFHMPTISQANEFPTRPSSSLMEYPQLYQQNVFPHRNDFAQPSLMPHFQREFSHPQSVDFNYCPLYHAESSHLPPLRLDKYKHNVPVSAPQDIPFHRETQFLGQEGEILDAQQREHHIHRKSFVHEEIQIPSSGLVPSSFPHGSTVHLRSLPLAGESFSNVHSVLGDLLQPRLLPKQDFSSVKDLPYSNHQISFAWPHDASSRFPSAPTGCSLVDPLVQKILPETDLPSQISSITMPKMPISMHHNPFASTFEQAPATTRLGYDASDLESRPKPSLPNFRLSKEQSSPNITGYTLETSGLPPHFPRKFVRELTGDTLYDPLFDSIEPSGILKKLVHAQKGQYSTDVSSVLKFSSLSTAADAPHNIEDRRIGASELKSVVDDSIEVAIDAEVGVVENDSPQLINEKDWSPDNLANTGAGEIDTDQVHSPGKKVKSKDSRSMKLFKIALAEFVKEVLKPSWRQGNMSKEAFKTIVKKTVDKVSRSVTTRQIPKTQAKIDQYVESSQRKLTKLVMGYVDKYVKM